MSAEVGPPKTGETLSAVNSMLDSSRRDLSIIAITELYDELDITLGESFSTPEFGTPEQEIK